MTRTGINPEPRLQADDLRGRAAVVIGASGGIGAASARVLAEAGVTVALGYHHGRERAQALADDLPGEGHFTFPIDVEDALSVSKASETALAGLGGLDILVNSAGTTRPISHADLGALDDAFFDRVLSSNVRGPFLAIRAFAPALKASGDGVVVNVSSISAFTGSGSNVAYCASKAALDTMTISLARALGPEIRVLCVSPGAVATDFVAGRGREQLQRIAAATPLRRVVEPQDVARSVYACVALLTASTGVRIVVDGGRHLA